MDQDLISKKDLLKETGISYGQLYRWKRKNLIPEEWFIRKSTYTGQETFFPRDKILQRVHKIISLKDDLSLDEIAQMFSPRFTEISLTKEQIQEKKIVSDVVLELHLSTRENEADVFTLEQLFYLFVLDQLLKTGEITLDEGKSLYQFLQNNSHRFEKKNAELFVVRKLGVTSYILVNEIKEICFDDRVKVLLRISLAEELEKLKGKIQQFGWGDANE
jgi:DNA-binding transcriptional MerR regulator